MPTSPHCLHTSDATSSSTLAFDWKPSRLQQAAHLGLMLLAPLAVMASDLPQWFRWCIGLLAVAHAVIDERKMMRRQPSCHFELDQTSGCVRCDGQPVQAFAVAWRGALAFARWEDAEGVRKRVVFWPDTLDGMQRRELRLAMQRRPSARKRPSVAG